MEEDVAAAELSTLSLAYAFYVPVKRIIVSYFEIHDN
jgi:hypothetical protein